MLTPGQLSHDIDENKLTIKAALFDELNCSLNGQS